MNTHDLAISITGLSGPDTNRRHQLGTILLKDPLKEIVPLSTSLASETLRHLKSDFAAKNHRPSARMWEAIADILRSLEDMADGVAERKVHLASLDPGVGKTQSVVHFLPVLLQSRKHRDVGVLICANRITQISAMIADAKAAGLRDEDFAVYTSDDAQNARGRGKSFSDVADLRYQSSPRQVRVWDEAITPGLAITLNNHALSALSRSYS